MRVHQQFFQPDLFNTMENCGIPPTISARDLNEEEYSIYRATRLSPDFSECTDQAIGEFILNVTREDGTLYNSAIAQRRLGII